MEMEGGMQRAPLPVELYLGAWAALAIPLGFAGLVFLVPGFYPVQGAVLLALAAGIVAYLWFLAKPEPRAWWIGLAGHLVAAGLAALHVTDGPAALAVPALALNALSLLVLLAYRRLWATAAP